jgi:hypothetical protein
VVTDEADADPIEAIAVETGRPNPLPSIVAWLAVAAVVVLAGWWVWNRWIDPPVGGIIARYVDNGGVKFENPADGFLATFPSKWTRSTSQNGIGTVVTVRSRPGEGYDFSVTKTPQPLSALDEYTTALNVIVGKFATDLDAEIVDQKPPVIVQDVVVKSATLRKGDTYWRVQLLLLRDRLYTIIAKTPGADPAPFERLTKSFLILGPH